MDLACISDNVYANGCSNGILNESINETSLDYIYITTLPMAIPNANDLTKSNSGPPRTH